METENIKQNIKRLRKEIAEAAEKSGRSLSDIQILAAIKNRNIAQIKAALDEDIDLIGENTMQAALDKFEFLPDQVEKHFIGHLQRNKVKEAIILFDTIQSVDSFDLAEEINCEAVKMDATIPIFVEVNASNDPERWGVDPNQVRSIVDEIKKLSRVKLKGIMAMPPYMEKQEKLRPIFREVKQVWDELQEDPNLELDYLSMGISNDFKMAIEEGSNLVRIGSYIFGSRKYH